MSFPAGIVRVFSGGMAPPVLSFRLLNAGAIEQFLPNAELLFRCGDAVAPAAPVAWGCLGSGGDAAVGSWYWGTQGARGDVGTLGGGGCSDGEPILGYRGGTGMLGGGGCSDGEMVLGYRGAQALWRWWM